MDRRKKRRTRFVVVLSCALLLAGALAYTSFSTANEAKKPSELIRSAKTDKTYQLTGKVVKGSIVKQGSAISFRVRDRRGQRSVPVSYRGVVPDPFRENREIIVNVRKQGELFVGEKNSLVTKCPSKFSEQKNKKSASAKITNKPKGTRYLRSTA